MNTLLLVLSLTGFWPAFWVVLAVAVVIALLALMAPKGSFTRALFTEGFWPIFWGIMLFVLYYIVRTLFGEDMGIGSGVGFGLLWLALVVVTIWARRHRFLNPRG